MGAKITIDSATLANKGLEVIEAHWLYDVDYDAIEVVIHPQSVVHSAVRFVDGSLKAQLGTPDMRLPIQYAMTYPDRRPSPAAPPDLIATARLDFRAPDTDRFPALRIAREAGIAGPRASAALIAADDVAVARFLDGTLDFRGHPAPPRGGRRAVRRERATRAGRRGPGRARCARSAPRSRADPIGGVGVTGFLQSIITIVLFLAILGILVVIHELGHFVTARLANVRVLEFGIGFPPRAKVLRREGRDPVHAQLAADRRLREARGRGRQRRRRSALVRRRSAGSRRLVILLAGVAMNVAARVRDLHRHRLAGLAAHGDPVLRGRRRTRRPQPAGLQPSDAIVADRRRAVPVHHRPDHRSTGCARGAGETVVLTVRPAPDGDAPRGHGHAATTRRPSTAGPGRPRASRRKSGRGRPTSTVRRPRTRCRRPIAVGAEQTVGALGLILGGLGTLVRSVAADPTAPPPVAGPSASRRRSATCSGTPARS